MAHYIKVLVILVLCNIYTQNLSASSSNIIEDTPRSFAKQATPKNEGAPRWGFYSLWDKVKKKVSSLIVPSSHRPQIFSADEESNPSWWEAPTSKGQEWEEQWNSMVMFIIKENIDHSKLVFSTANYREAIYASEGRNLSHHAKLRKMLGGEAQQEAVRDRLFHQNAKNIHLKQYGQFLSSFRRDQRENFPLMRQSLKDFYQKVRGTSIEGDCYDGDIFQRGYALAECLWKIGDLKRQASNLNLLRETILRSYKLMNGGELDELIYDDLKAATVIAPTKQSSSIIKAVKGSSLLLLTLSASLINTTQAMGQRSVAVDFACTVDYKQCESGYTLLDFYSSAPEVNSILSNNIVLNATQNSLLNPDRLTALSMTLDNINQLTNTTGWLSEVTAFSVTAVPNGNATRVIYAPPAPFTQIDYSLISDTSHYYNAYQIDDIYQPATLFQNGTISNSGTYYFLDQFPNTEVWFFPVMINDTFGVGTAVMRPSQGNPSILWQRVMTKESSFNTTGSAALPLRTIEMNKPVRATEEQGLTQDDLGSLHSGDVGEPYCAGNQTIFNFLNSQSSAITTLANRFISCMQNPVLDASSCFRTFGTYDSAYFRLSYFFMEDNLGSRLYTRRIYDGPSYQSCSYKEISSNQVQEDCHSYTWTPVISNINSTSQLLSQSLSSISGSTAPGNVHKILEYFFTSSSVDGIVVHTVQNSSGIFGPNYYAYCLTPIVPTIGGPTLVPTDANEPTQSPSNTSGLSDEAKIGIGVGAGAVGLAAIGTGVGFGIYKHKQKKNKEGSFADNDDLEKNGGNRSQSVTSPITREAFKAVKGKGIKDARIRITGAMHNKEFALYLTIDQNEALKLFASSGLKIDFPVNQEEIDLILGAGNFGQVRVARDEETGEFRAIKIVAGRDKVEASLREGQLQAHLGEKEGVLPLLEYLHYEPTADNKKEMKHLLLATFGSTTIQGEDMISQDLLLQVTPLAALGNGDNFQNMLSQVKSFDLKDQLLSHFVRSVLTGLNNMHNDGVSHLDIKPSNILVHSDGTIYISDFGCAVQKDNIKGGIGDFSYFDPQRVAYNRGLAVKMGHKIASQEMAEFYSGHQADNFAAGLSFLQIALNGYPLGIEEGGILGIIEARNYEYFTMYLKDAFEKVDARFSALPVIKGLLAVNEKERWTTAQALRAANKLKVKLKSKELFEYFERDLNEPATSQEVELAPQHKQPGIIEVVKRNKPNAYFTSVSSNISEQSSSALYGAEMPFYNVLQEVYKSSPDETRSLLSYDTLDLSAAPSQGLTYDTVELSAPPRKQGNTTGVWAYQN